MKVGDLIKLPQNLGYSIAVEVLAHDNDPNMPTGNKAVMVIEEWGEEWWDTAVCEVVGEI